MTGKGPVMRPLGGIALAPSRTLLALLAVLLVLTVPPTTSAVSMTSTPAELSASQIRSGEAEVTIRAEAPAFSTAIGRNVLPIANASDGSQMIVYAGDEDGRLAEFVNTGELRATVREVTATTIKLRLHSPRYYAYAHQTFFAVLLRPALIPAAMSDGPFTARVEIPSEHSFMREPREITVGATGAVSLLLALIGKETHTGMLSLGRQSLLTRVLECSNELDFILHPTQLSVGGSKIFGSLMMTMSIVIFLIAFHTAVLRQFPKIFSPHLPADHLLLLLVIYPGTTLTTAETVATTEAPVRWSLALVILFLAYLAVLASLYSTWDSNVKYSDRFRAWGHRFDATFVPRWRVLFKPYRGGMARLYIVIELFFTCVLAVASASPHTSQTHEGCFYQAALGVAVVAVDLLILVALWPYHTGRDFAFAALLKTVETGIAAEAVIATKRESVDSTMVIAGNAIAIFGAVVVLAKYTASVVIAARGSESAVDNVSAEYLEMVERDADRFIKPGLAPELPFTPAAALENPLLDAPPPFGLFDRHEDHGEAAADEDPSSAEHEVTADEQLRESASNADDVARRALVVEEEDVPHHRQDAVAGHSADEEVLATTATEPRVEEEAPAERANQGMERPSSPDKHSQQRGHHDDAGTTLDAIISGGDLRFDDVEIGMDDLDAAVAVASSTHDVDGAKGGSRPTETHAKLSHAAHQDPALDETSLNVTPQRPAADDTDNSQGPMNVSMASTSGPRVVSVDPEAFVKASPLAAAQSGNRGRQRLEPVFAEVELDDPQAVAQAAADASRISEGMSSAVMASPHPTEVPIARGAHASVERSRRLVVPEPSEVKTIDEIFEDLSTILDDADGDDPVSDILPQSRMGATVRKARKRRA